jgi:hypothetical protein
MGGSAAYAQAPTPVIDPWMTSWVAASMTEEGQRYPTPGFSLSESQRRGMRWGAQIGIFAGLGIAWIAAAPDDDCEGFQCVGQAAALPLYVGVGLLGGMVAGGAVGLAIGTLVDDGGEPRSAMELTISFAP